MKRKGTKNEIPVGILRNKKVGNPVQLRSDFIICSETAL
jgi:hypothetical protein